MATNQITVDAIYQDGVIKLMSPIDLPNNTLVKVQITKPDEPLKGRLAQYKGILGGQGDFTWDEIKQTVHSAREAHLEKLVSKLTERA